MKRCVLLLLTACLLPPAVSASPVDDLREEWLSEVGRLERAIERYADIAAEQTEAFAGLETARLAVDDAIANPETKAAELRELENRLTRVRDAAVRQADAASEARRRIYEALELVEDLGARIEDSRRDTQQLVSDSGVAGLWAIEWEGEAGYGLVRLETKANFVLGTYRLSNGNAGTLKGTATGRNLELEVIHSIDGTVGNVRIVLDSDGSAGDGDWYGRDVGGSRPGGARFRLERTE
jgi:hypothetical protein